MPPALAAQPIAFIFCLDFGVSERRARMALAAVVDFGGVPVPVKGVPVQGWPPDGAGGGRDTGRGIARDRQIILPLARLAGIGAVPAAERHLPPPPEGSGRGAAIDLLA
jgi:hypothetical protein